MGFLSRVLDPHNFSADLEPDPDPAFYFIADLAADPVFDFNSDPDPYPVPNQGDVNLQPLAYRPS